MATLGVTTKLRALVCRRDLHVCQSLLHDRHTEYRSRQGRWLKIGRGRQCMMCIGDLSWPCSSLHLQCCPEFRRHWSRDEAMYFSRTAWTRNLDALSCMRSSQRWWGILYQLPSWPVLIARFHPVYDLLRSINQVWRRCLPSGELKSQVDKSHQLASKYEWYPRE